MVEEECKSNKKSLKMPASEDCTPRQKSDVGRAARKAKRVRFLVNGDRFCKGKFIKIKFILILDCTFLFNNLPNTK